MGLFCSAVSFFSFFFFLFVVKLNPFSNDQVSSKDKITLDFTQNYTLPFKVVILRGIDSSSLLFFETFDPRVGSIRRLSPRR